MLSTIAKRTFRRQPRVASQKKHRTRTFQSRKYATQEKSGGSNTMYVVGGLALAGLGAAYLYQNGLNKPEEEETNKLIVSVTPPTLTHNRHPRALPCLRTAHSPSNKVL